MSTTAPLAGKYGDAVIYNAEFFGGFTETLQQASDVFNEASAGAIRLVPRVIEGDLEKESFYKDIPNIIRDRDPNSNADVADKKLTMDEFIRVKISKGIGPVAQTRDFFLRHGRDPSTMSFVLGQLAGKAAAVDYVNTGLSSLVAAMQTVPGTTYDNTVQMIGGTAAPSVRVLNQGLRLFGDARDRIVAWVMAGDTHADLVDNDIAEKIDGVAVNAVYMGTPATLNRPVIITDSPALDIAAVGGATPTPAKRIILGLTQEALELAQSEGEYVTMQEVTGQQNIIWRMQGEYSYNVGVRGFQYTGLVQPDIADLSNQANWSYRFTDRKLGAGVVILVNDM